MKIKRIILCLLLSLGGGINAGAQLKHLNDSVTLPSHPRLLMTDDDVLTIRNNVNNSKQWAGISDAIVAESDRIIGLPTLNRVQVGRRILDTSREALRRIFHLSYSFRITQDEKYKIKAESEMLAIAAFSDWNPSHFLDVAEMTMAMSIGYDWLYNSLSDTSRRQIKDAIVKHGLDPSFSPVNNGWLQSAHNWNQVCNAGITFGAIAVYEDMPQLSKLLIDRAIESIKLPMEKYGPDGAYPEGVTYWSYGTSFNVMFLSAIEKLFGSDFGLSEIAGFLQSATYLNNMIAPSHDSFNYGDCGDKYGLNPTVFWFAEKTQNSSLLCNQLYFMNDSDKTSFTGDRLFPAIMIWGQNADMGRVANPENKVWAGQGVTPVASMRTSWNDPNAVFVGLKAGRAGSNHSHMDIGSFVMESDGVRWAIDLGIQDYNSLESAGVDLWNRKQDSQRWDVFRYNNFAHSTLTFDGQKQDVDGYAYINSYGSGYDFIYAISDITNAYRNQVKSSKRGIAIVSDSYVCIRDEIETTAKDATVQWRMITRADVRIKGEKSVELTMNGKKLEITIESPNPFTIKTWSAKSQNAFDESNEDVTIVGFESVIPADSKAAFDVKLLPPKAKNAKRKIPALADWK